jgi:hypothetical protein
VAYRPGCWGTTSACRDCTLTGPVLGVWRPLPAEPAWPHLHSPSLRRPGPAISAVLPEMTARPNRRIRSQAASRAIRSSSLRSRWRPRLLRRHGRGPVRPVRFPGRCRPRRQAGCRGCVNLRHARDSELLCCNHRRLTDGAFWWHTRLVRLRHRLSAYQVTTPSRTHRRHRLAGSSHRVSNSRCRVKRRGHRHY